MKRTGLHRRTPLVARTPLLRRTPLRRTSALASGASGVKGRPVGGESSAPARGLARSGGHRVPVDVARALAERSGGRCEIGLPSTCRGEATQKHHRITQKAGGRHRAAAARHDRLSNLLHACGPCHDLVTGRPMTAYRLGLSLREWQDPAREPVRRCGGLVYLADDGSIHSYERAGA